MARTITVQISSDDPDLFAELGNGDEIVLAPGLTGRRELGDGPAVLDLAPELFLVFELGPMITGVASSLIATWLYNALQRKRVGRVLIERRDVLVLDKDHLEMAITESLE